MKKTLAIILLIILVTACKKSGTTPDNSLPDNGILIEITEPDHTQNADYAYLSTTSVANSSARMNVALYGSFSVIPSTIFYWSDTDITAGFILILQHKYMLPAVGTHYKIIYYTYSPGVGTQQTKTFVYTSTGFVLKI